jgi:predicted NBD/HSP70 family sugar kinase
MRKFDTAPINPSIARGSNQIGMRAHNERLVLTLIRQHGALAKAEVARLTGLSPQTVSVIMRALEVDVLLQRDTPVRGKIGQPSTPMSLRADGAFFFGLSISRRSLDLVLIDFLGTERSRARVTHRFPTPDQAVQFAIGAVAQLTMGLTNIELERIGGLGIAMPFHLWEWAGRMRAPPEKMDEWQHRDIAAEIAAQINIPVYLRNDASAACGAELVFGRPDKPSNFLYFFLAFFIGGGLVLDNRLFTGPTGNEAALGAMPVYVPQAEMLNPAQQKKCQLIDVASLVSLEALLLAEGQDPALIWENSHQWQVSGPALDRWLDQAAEGLAQATYAAACLVDFSQAIVDGWLPALVREELVRRANAAMAKLPMAGVERPVLREGSIGGQARALGAASLPLSARFLVDHNAGQNT